MTQRALSRRKVLRGSAAAALCAFAEPLRAAAPAAAPITPALIEAAKAEGKVAFYTAMDLPVAEKLGKTFEARYPGVSVRVERAGAERVFQRVGQEMSANIHAVDVINSSDARALHRLEARRLACAVSARGRRRAFSCRLLRSRRLVLHHARLAVVARLQCEPGEGRGRAEKLCRSARSEMDRPDGEGASGL